MKRLLQWLLLASVALANAALAVDRNFSVPIDDLKKWSDAIVIQLRGVTVKGASGVHGVKSDCEMHFGATVDGYKGDPDGWVLEPMNVCVEPFKHGGAYSKKEWLDFARSLRNKRVTAYGVPRIWPEHLIGGKWPSNPNHAMELHPLTKLSVQGKTHDFTSFIYAPDGFPGGLSDATAYKILDELEVHVTEQGGEVEIEFDAGRIGNFASLAVRLGRVHASGCAP